jgi:hypothetical protein
MTMRVFRSSLKNLPSSSAEEIGTQEVFFLGNADLLRALLGAVRESFEEVPPGTYADRIGASAQEVRQWGSTLREIYNEMKGHRPTTEHRAILCRRLGESAPESGEPPAETVIVAMDERELSACISLLRTTLEIEDWEYGLRMGFEPKEIEELIARLGEPAA